MTGGHNARQSCEERYAKPMSQTLETPEQMVRARSEEPHVYEAGDCWRFTWEGHNSGSFDTERDAQAAAHRLKQQTMMKLAAASLHLR